MCRVFHKRFFPGDPDPPSPDRSFRSAADGFEVCTGYRLRVRTKRPAKGQGTERSTKRHFVSSFPGASIQITEHSRDIDVVHGLRDELRDIVFPMQKELFPRRVAVRFGKEWIWRPRYRPLPQPITPEEQQTEKRSEESLQTAVFLSGEFELARKEDEDIPGLMQRIPRQSLYLMLKLKMGNTGRNPFGL